MKEIHKSYTYSQHLTTCTDYEEQLLQIFHGCQWDGDLINKPARNKAVGNGHVDRYDGWNFITLAGVQFLADNGAVEP